MAKKAKIEKAQGVLSSESSVESRKEAAEKRSGKNTTTALGPIAMPPRGWADKWLG